MISIVRNLSVGRRFSILAFALVAAPNLAFAVGTKFDLEAALGYTSNADLESEGGTADRIRRVGAYYLFPVSDTQGRAAVRYSDYAKRSNNDLLSLDLGTKWNLGGLGKTSESGRTFEARMLLRDYVHDQAATTDTSFTNYGLLGRFGWYRDLPSGDELRFSPQGLFLHYPKFSNRNDFDATVRVEYALYGKSKESVFIVEGAPGILLSTEADFSKIYLMVGANYETPIGERSSVGGFLNLMPAYYLSRETTSLALAAGRKRGTTTVTEKESTLLFSPGAWWLYRFSLEWEFRLDSQLNIQSSKSGAYDYSEFQLAASVRYRAI